MMKCISLIVLAVWVSLQCGAVPIDYAVVSVYTTQPTNMGESSTLDVYQQIANNIAERFTFPIYRFFGYTSTTEIAQKMTEKESTWETLELLNETDSKPQVVERRKNAKEIAEDIVELTVAGINGQDKKPEKLTLYSSLMPILHSMRGSSNITDSELETLNDTEAVIFVEPKERPFLFVMELFSSILQLICGGFTTLLSPPDGNSTNTKTV